MTGMFSSLAMALRPCVISDTSCTRLSSVGAAQELQVVDHQHVQPVGAFQAAGAGGDLGDGQRGGVVDEERAGLQRLGGLDEAAELGLGHVAAADLFGGDLGRLGQDPGGELFGATFRG